MTPESDATRVARDLLASLAAGGVRHLVLAPGSRSAPLAYAALDAEAAGLLQVHVRVDERVAGFVALGLAKAGAGPVVVATTSGTAVANLHPAVLEASHAGVPLVVLSADRPHELRGTGANQTTVQPGIFATAPRWSGEIPAGPASRRQVVQQVTRALAAATGSLAGGPGPVHLNVAFAEPLTPTGPWLPQPVAIPQVAPAGPGAATHVLRRGPRTVVVAGDGAGSPAGALADAAGWPLLAEPSSGARTAVAAIPAYRVVLEELGQEIQRAIVFGHPTLSRPVSRVLARDDVEIVVVTSRGLPWTDVAGTAAQVATGVALADRCAAGGDVGTGDAHDAEGAGERTVSPEDRADAHWLGRWRRAGRAAAEALTSGVPGGAGAGPDGAELDGAGFGGTGFGGAVLDGLAVASRVATDARPVLVVGSSLAIRDLDLMAPAGPGSAPETLANRGLAGIDGTIATATGVALARRAPVRVLLGDLSFVHDLGALARGDLEQEVDLQVVVLNDHGGGIFATLEHGRPEHADAFERVFGTPQHIDIAALAAGFGASHRRVTTRAELDETLGEPIRGRGVVEVILDRRDLGARRAELIDRARAAIPAAGPE